MYEIEQCVSVNLKQWTLHTQVKSKFNVRNIKNLKFSRKYVHRISYFMHVMTLVSDLWNGEKVFNSPKITETLFMYFVHCNFYVNASVPLSANRTFALIKLTDTLKWILVSRQLYREQSMAKSCQDTRTEWRLIINGLLALQLLNPYLSAAARTLQ